MDNLIEEYIAVKQFLGDHLYEMAQIYLTGFWDPLIKHNIIRETKKVINTELLGEFPDFPRKYLPHLKLKINEEEKTIEATIQEYLNQDASLHYLGSTEYGLVIYDLYCRESWDPSFSHIFYARYGHDTESVEKGSRKSAAEFMAGIVSPLSIAYGLALEEGFISKNYIYK